MPIPIELRHVRLLQLIEDKHPNPCRQASMVAALSADDRVPASKDGWARKRDGAPLPYIETLEQLMRADLAVEVRAGPDGIVVSPGSKSWVLTDSGRALLLRYGGKVAEKPGRRAVAPAALPEDVDVRAEDREERAGQGPLQPAGHHQDDDEGVDDDGGEKPRRAQPRK